MPAAVLRFTPSQLATEKSTIARRKIDAVCVKVTMTPSELSVRKISRHGAVAEWKLNPIWVRLDRQTHQEFGIERLFLVSRGRRLPIAGFLGAREKEAFAVVLSAALAEARRGPTRTIVD